MQRVTKQLFCDVAVIGGGVAGCTAAIEAARNGYRTILFERGVSLGGLATNGYVPQIAGNIEGICYEFAQRLDELGQVRMKSDYDGEYRNPIFEPEYGKIVLEDMLFESGARLVLDSVFIDVEKDGSNISQAVFYTKGGLMHVKARIYIDATGDADVAAAAGVPYEVGGQDFAGLNMSTTYGSRWAGANLVKLREASDAWLEEQKAKGVKNPLPLLYVLEEEAIKRGELARHTCSSFRSMGFHQGIIPQTTEENADFFTFAFHAYYCHNTDVEDITRQIQEQRQLMKNFHAFLRKYVPGFENVRLVGTGSLPGGRESRRIFGEYMLKASDVACRVKFSDGIARFPEFLDVHHPTSSDHVFIRHIHMEKPGKGGIARPCQCPADMHPFGRPRGMEVRASVQDYCEIPYRSLIPLEVDNLFVVGRCSSAEFHANGAVRIIGPSMGTGQAAGLAAGVAISQGKRPRDIKGEAIRELLISKGVELNKPCSGHWKMMRELDCDYEVGPGDALLYIPKKKEGCV